jgi:hypothetical protein
VEPFFQGFSFPIWISWVAPAAALAAAGIFSFWIILQRSRIALQAIPPLPAKPSHPVPPSAHISPAEPASKPQPAPYAAVPATAISPPSPLKPAFAGARARLRSGLFRRCERRLALRRGSEPFPVDLNDACASGAAYLANILDRSKSGLCIAVTDPVALNTILSVRSRAYADAAVWVQIRVRHCRQKDHQWLLGCSFVTEQPWSVLLMFG